MKKQKDMDARIVFESPMSNLKGNWLELIKTQLLACSNAVLQSVPQQSETFHYSFLLLLNLIPGGADGKDRHRIYEAYATRLDEREKEEKNLTNEKKLRIRQETEMEIIGEIVDYVDRFLGIREKLVMDRTVVPVSYAEEQDKEQEEEIIE